jgi:predicted acetyltransferase
MGLELTLRSAQPEDLAQIVNLDRLAFAPLRTNAELEQEWYGGTIALPGRSLVLAVETATGQGVGSYAQIELEIRFAGKDFPAMGIAAVAVAPQRRGQQVARVMLEQAITVARSQHLPLIMLYPFQHGFYRRLGWVWVGQSHQYRVAARQLPLFGDRLKLYPYEPQHQAAVERTYAAAMQNGWLQRQAWQWQDWQKPNKGLERFVYLEGEPTASDALIAGYVVIQYAQLEPPRNLLAAIVREWVALTPAAYRGILGFLGSLRDQVSPIVWNGPVQDPFPHLLTEQRQDPALTAPELEFGLVHRFGTIGGGFMWRLVDLDQAFALRPIQSGVAFGLTFVVHDPILGDRTLSVEFGAGQMQVVDTQQATIVTCTIDQLTALFAGVRRATELLWTGELALTGDAQLLHHLDRAWQTTAPFCWDFF